MRKFFTLFIPLFWTTIAFTQIKMSDIANPTDPDANAILELESTTLGFIVSRLSAANRPAADATNKGMIIYNIDTDQLEYCNGTDWVTLVGADNLGNHTAIANIQLNGNYLSNDGGNDGITITNDGELTLTSSVARSLKSASSFSSNYIEINNSANTRALFGADGNGFTGGPTSDVVLGNWSNGGLNFYTNASNRMSIDNVGLVNISNKLTVSDTLFTNGVLKVNGTLRANGAGHVIETRGANNSLNLAIREEYANAGAISFYNTSGNERIAQFIDTNTDVGALFVYGPSTQNIVLGNLSGHNDNGYIAVADNTGVLDAGMYIDAAGNGIVYGNTKSFRIDHPKDNSKEIWYACIEGPEAAAYVRGTAELINGKAIIPFPEHFILVASPETLTVTLTPNSGSSKGLAVVKKTAEGFEVEELSNGTGSYPFDWVAMAVRLGHEDFEVVREKKELIKGRRPQKAD